MEEELLSGPTSSGMNRPDNSSSNLTHHETVTIMTQPPIGFLVGSKELVHFFLDDTVFERNELL